MRTNDNSLDISLPVLSWRLVMTDESLDNLLGRQRQQQMIIAVKPLGA